MKVIFLEIDGVLNNFDYDNTVRDIYKKTGKLIANIDPKNLKVLRRMVEITGARIVLLSNGELNLNNYRENELKRLLSEQGLVIADTTEYLFSSISDEVDNFLKKHRNIDDFVILSGSSEIRKYKSKLIQTDYGDGGLKEGHIRVLKNKMKIEDIYDNRGKIERALDQIYKPDYDHLFDRIYPFTTENISGYINEFDLENKSLLTVGSSSDQVLNAFYNGCCDITLIDINPFIKEYFHLKQAAIETLNYEYFLQFLSFGGYLFHNYNVLDKKVFQEVLEQVKDVNSKEFWNNLLEFSSPSKIRKNLFVPDKKRIFILKQLNNYLKDEDSYEKVRNKISYLNPKFINADIYNYHLKKNYDNIFLSNISDYNHPKDTIMLHTRLKNNLTDNGKLLGMYCYDTEYLHRIILDKELGIMDGMKLKSFPSVESYKSDHDNSIDSIFVYTKK